MIKEGFLYVALFILTYCVVAVPISVIAVNVAGLEPWSVGGMCVMFINLCWFYASIWLSTLLYDHIMEARP